MRQASDLAGLIDQAQGFHAANPSGSVFLMHADFPQYEGEVLETPFLRIGLATRGGGRYVQSTGVGRIDAALGPGSMVIVPPYVGGEGRCAPVSMIGLAVDLNRWPAGRSTLSAEQIAAAASRIQHDDALGAVITAMRHAAELHGCSTLFFEHGVEVVLGRIGTLSGMPFARSASALERARLDRVFDLVESRLGGDLSVVEMAAAANCEVSGFTRAFRRATGRTPFGYLTTRRMEKAALLLEGGVPVTTAALAVGYANASKFAAAFRRTMGLAPSEWRRRRA